MGNAPYVATSPLAGRVAEQRRLGELLSDSAAGRPAAVLVHGEAGVGKTRLVREVTEHFHTLGHEVLWGTCVHFGTASVPFAPIGGESVGLSRFPQRDEALRTASRRVPSSGKLTDYRSRWHLGGDAP